MLNLNFLLLDLCAEIKCELGEICVIEDYQARCDCFEACEQTVDERTKVKSLRVTNFERAELLFNFFD